VKQKILILVLCILATSFLSATSYGFDRTQYYEVAVTNVTSGQTFTPIVVLTHRKGVKLFTPGEPASGAMAMLAEGGDTGPLTMMMSMNPNVVDIVTSEGMLGPGPGETKTVMISSERGAHYISLAAMMIPTNDGFIALNGVHAPLGRRTVMYLSPAYDAGSEENDESCAHIPGPFGCDGMGEGYNPDDDAEGHVHIHAGIHGIGDLDDAAYDWRNPVARIVIKKVVMAEEDEED
jgi:hypothetical protein